MSNKFLLDEIFIRKIVCCLMKKRSAMLCELLLFMSIFKCFCFILLYIFPTYTISQHQRCQIVAFEFILKTFNDDSCVNNHRQIAITLLTYKIQFSQ